MVSPVNIAQFHQGTIERLILLRRLRQELRTQFPYPRNFRFTDIHIGEVVKSWSLSDLAKLIPCDTAFNHLFWLRIVQYEIKMRLITYFNQGKIRSFDLITIPNVGLVRGTLRQNWELEWFGAPRECDLRWLAPRS